MQWIMLAMAFIPKVIELMKNVEKLLDGEPDTGAQKKEYILGAIKAIFEGITGASGALDKNEMWEKIEAALSSFIDVACYFIFPKKKAGA